MSQGQLPNHPNVFRVLHPELEAAAQRSLAATGVNTTNYENKTLKDRILESIVVAYWKGLAKYAEDNGLFRQHCEGVLSEEVLGFRLGVNPGTISRWLNDKTPPGGDKVLGAVVIVLQKEITEIVFPKNREIAWQAVSRTLSLIREEDCHRNRRPITREEFACMWLLGRHPNADKVVVDQPRAAASAIIDDVFRELKKQFPKMTSRDFVAQTAGEWTMPYLYFAISLLPGWEFLDDGSVASV